MKTTQQPTVTAFVVLWEGTFKGSPARVVKTSHSRLVMVPVEGDPGVWSANFDVNPDEVMGR